MKRITLLILAAFITISIFTLTACGGGNNETSAAPAASTTPAVSTSTATQSATDMPTTQAAGNVDWSDMPSYPGAVQVKMGEWAVPDSEQANYTKFEWRYYESSDAAADVMAYLKDKMPGLGWTEDAYMPIAGSYWGLYLKNDKKDGAVIWVSSKYGAKAVIAMMRGVK